jgi:hypothetical protein
MHRPLRSLTEAVRVWQFSEELTRTTLPTA